LPYPRKETKLPIILSEEEMKRLIDIPKNSKHQLVICILYGCGLRVGELINLKLVDIDRGQMCLHIKGAKGNKDRTVGISENLLSLIEKYYQYWRPKGYLFNGQFCLRYTASSINQFLRRYAKQAGINKHVHCHLLRTCYAVHSLDKKVNMGLLQRSMGHGSIKVTHHYTKLSNAHLKNCLI
jgi:site-specific recombinase XerD